MDLNVSPVYKKVLIAALVLWVVGVTFMLSDLYIRSVQQDHKIGHKVGFLKQLAQIPTTPAK